MTQTSRQAEAVRIWRETGSKAEVGRQLGISYRNAHSLIDRALAHEVEPDGVTEALEKAAAQGADTVWLKSKEASIKWTRPKPEADPLAFLDAIKAGLTDVPRAGHVDAPSGPSDLMAVFPVADLHIGMLADPEETGTAWDTKIAMRTFGDVFQNLVAVTPAAGTALLVQLGDLLHIDDQRNVTPASKHQLDADSRYFKVLRRSVATMKGAIEALRLKYPQVIYRGQRGNHDEHAHHAVTVALAEHYHDTPGVRIVESAGDYFVHQFGHNMLVTHHGDRVTPQQLANLVAAQYAPLWGRTTYRLALSGHLHKAKSEPVGGLICETVGTLIPRDAYAASRFPEGDRALTSITFRREGGWTSRARVGV